MALVDIQIENTAASAVAEAVVSGGTFLSAGSYTSVVSSASKAYYSPAYVKVQSNGSGLNCIGIALHDAASGSYVSFATEGVFIVPGNGNIVAGQPIGAAGSSTYTGAIVAAATDEPIVGRAWTSCASGGYCIIHLNA